MLVLKQCHFELVWEKWKTYQKLSTTTALGLNYSSLMMEEEGVSKPSRVQVSFQKHTNQKPPAIVSVCNAYLVSGGTFHH